MNKNNQEKIIDTFVEAIGEFGASLGISKVVAQIYALLYLSEKPLSLDNISETLKISKGNVSINIRYLENWQAVKRVWIKGERKDFYEANPDIKRIIYLRLKEGLQRRIDKFNQRLNQIEPNIKNTPYRKKIEEIRKILKITNKIDSIGKILTKKS